MAKDTLQQMLESGVGAGNKLFCYPAESNVSGVCHNLGYTTLAQDYGYDVLLDTAAYNALHKVDLSKVKPDFLPASLYKMIGWPTGLGWLIIKIEKYAKLRKTHFAGGSNRFVSVKRNFDIPEINHANFEDGTIAFNLVPIIPMAFKYLDALGDPTPRVYALVQYLNESLRDLSYKDKKVVVYTEKHNNDKVVFNIKKGNDVQSSIHFELAAKGAGISVREGCFCNPALGEIFLGYDVDKIIKGFKSFGNQSTVTQRDLKGFITNGGDGSIRASMHFFNNFNDVNTFISFVQKYLTKL